MHKHTLSLTNTYIHVDMYVRMYVCIYIYIALLIFEFLIKIKLLSDFQ